MRLFLILYLSCPMLEDALLHSFVGYLRKAGADMGVFAHLMEVRSLEKRPNTSIRTLDGGEVT